MRTEQEINDEIDVIKFARNEWIQKQNDFKWTDLERQNGSVLFGMYQENESKCNQKIILLEWVLGLRECPREYK